MVCIVEKGLRRRRPWLKLISELEGIVRSLASSHPQRDLVQVAIDLVEESLRQRLVSERDAYQAREKEQ
jgi:hypothetical protein